MMLPQFTYKKGQLYLHEIAVLNALSNAFLNFDKSWVLPFQSRKDARDSRPLTYPGRAVVGVAVEEKDWLFRSCSLIRDGRAAPAEQLAATNMLRVEDPDPDALPAGSTMADVTGARKYEQVGPNAFLKVLEACLEGTQLEGKSGLIICDLHLGVGDSFNAWLQKRGSLNVPTGFFGLTDDGVTQEQASSQFPWISLWNSLLHVPSHQSSMFWLDPGQTSSIQSFQTHWSRHA